MPTRTTIQAKLVKTSLAVLVPVFALVTLAVVVLNIYLGGKAQAAAVGRIESSLKAKGRLLTANNAQALVGMAEGNAFGQIKDLVASTVSGDADVVFGAFLMADSSMPWVVVDGSDSIKALGVLAKAEDLRDPSLGWARSQKAVEMRKVGTGASEAIEYAAPVGEPGAPLGWILYKLSTTSMQEAIVTEKRNSRNAMIQVVVLLVAVGAGAMFFSLRRFGQDATSLSRPVRELAAAAEIIKNGDYKQAVKVESDDEIGDLASTFETMRQTVQIYTEHLEELIEAKMRQVRDILDNVEQGLFAVGFDGGISPEHSKAAPEILGVEELRTVRDALHLSPTQEEDFVGWLNLVRTRHASMRWEKLTKVAPVQDLEIPSPNGEVRYVRVRYQRMYDKNREVEKIMVLAQDETEARRIERVVAEEKDRHENEVRTILGLVNNLPEVIKDFQKDARRRLDDLQDLTQSMLERSRAAREKYPDVPGYKPSADEIGKLFRDLHTIKGNAGTYGFDRLSKLAHLSEDILEDLKEPITVRTAVTLQALLGKLEEMDAAYQEILETEKRLSGGGGDGDAMVQVSERKLDHVRRMAKAMHSGNSLVADSEAVKTLAEACERIRDVPLVRLSEKYRGLVGRLSDKLGKQIHFECVPSHLEVSPHFFQPIDEALVHLLRNSVDHGIEAASDRVVGGKPERGTIRLEISVNDDQVSIILSDDGAGIDLDRVSARAIEQGLATPSEIARLSDDQRMQLIFESGISTASSITDVSGRGVGMAAVKDCIDALGGLIHIKSVRGKGSQAILQLPARFAA
jgi:two-component system, chemotaxis family, sensor kinase CheA